MRIADAETLYIFFKNEAFLHEEMKLCNRKVINLYKLYNDDRHIKREASFFAEAYLPFMQKYIFRFLDDQKRMENPYKLPSKEVMLETAKIFAEETILDYYGEKIGTITKGS